ncbi:DUF7289 family protein [Geoglobus sp.]
MSSEVVGTMIVMLIISMTVGMLFISSQSVLFQGKESLREKDAYFTMLDVNEKINQVRFGMEPTAIVKIHFNSYSASFRNEPIITVNGTQYNVSSIAFYGNGWEVIMENGAIIGKWGEDAEMLSPPPVYLTGKTLTLPIISFNGTFSAGGTGYATLRITLENVSLIKTGPAEIKIRSSNYLLWKSFFEGLNLSPTVSGSEVSVSVDDSYIVLYRVRLE